MSSSSCIVIIPAKNEVLHLQKVLEGVWEFFSPEEIVVIDDHSSDGTPELALQCGATVLSHPISLGYAATLQTGYKYALSKGYPYLIQLDGDGQHLPLSIPTLYTALQGNQADLVLGNRFLSPDFPYHPSFARRVGMRFFCKFVAFVYSIIPFR